MSPLQTKVILSTSGLNEQLGSQPTEINKCGVCIITEVLGDMNCAGQRCGTVIN